MAVDGDTVAVSVMFVPVEVLTEEEARLVVVAVRLPVEIAGYAFSTSMLNSVSQNVPAGGAFGIELTALLLANAF